MHSAVALSIGRALCGALYSILTRLLAGRDSTATQQFYAALVATLGIAPFALADWSWPQHAASWFAFVLIGLFGWLGHQLVIIAHRFAPASACALRLVQILYMAASSWLIFPQPPDVWVIVGAGIVGASGLYIWLRERALAATPIVSRGHPLQRAGKFRRKDHDRPQIVLVTGASQGIGAATARAFAAAGLRSCWPPGTPPSSTRWRRKSPPAAGRVAGGLRRHRSGLGRGALRPHPCRASAGSTWCSTTPGELRRRSRGIRLGGLAAGGLGQPRRRVPDRCGAFRMMRDQRPRAGGSSTTARSRRMRRATGRRPTPPPSTRSPGSPSRFRSTAAPSTSPAARSTSATPPRT